MLWWYVVTTKIQKPNHILQEAGCHADGCPRLVPKNELKREQFPKAVIEGLRREGAIRPWNLLVRWSRQSHHHLSETSFRNSALIRRCFAFVPGCWWRDRWKLLGLTSPKEGQAPSGTQWEIMRDQKTRSKHSCTCRMNHAVAAWRTETTTWRFRHWQCFWSGRWLLHTHTFFATWSRELCGGWSAMEVSLRWASRPPTTCQIGRLWLESNRVAEVALPQPVLTIYI